MAFAAKAPAQLSSREFLALAGYILGDEIGAGTYSKVRVCVRNGMKYAMKIVPLSAIPTDYLKSFLPREVEIVTTLNHPNIVRHYEVLEIHQKIFMVMELCTNGDLLTKIKGDGHFSESKAFGFFEQICDAVSYLHERHIVHRDLKCENILLGPYDQVKLADFSFTRYVYSQKRGTRVLSRTFCGSSAYAAPEVIQNIKYRPKRADCWSLGVILYVMVVGELPFDDTNPYVQVRQQMSRSIAFPETVSKPCKNLMRHLMEPVVMYRASVKRALKHPWMRRERIKRKLRYLKEKQRLAKARETATSGGSPARGAASVLAGQATPQGPGGYLTVQNMQNVPGLYGGPVTYPYRYGQNVRLCFTDSDVTFSTNS